MISARDSDESVHNSLSDKLWLSLELICQKFLVTRMGSMLSADVEEVDSFDNKVWSGACPSSKLITWDMFGRRVGDALVHKSATFSIKSASSFEYSWPRLGSTSSSSVPLSCNTHAYCVKFQTSFSSKFYRLKDGQNKGLTSVRQPVCNWAKNIYTLQHGALQYKLLL